MRLAMQLIGLIFGIGMLIMLFVSLYLPGNGLDGRLGHNRQQAILLGALFGFSSLVCFVLAFTQEN